MIAGISTFVLPASLAQASDVSHCTNMIAIQDQVDDQGNVTDPIDDVPAQSDQNSMAFDFQHYCVSWTWDDTLPGGEGSGGNTGDACALFDTDGDGGINYALCAQVDSDGATPPEAVFGADGIRFFSCDDATNKPLNCTGAVPITYTSVGALELVPDSFEDAYDVGDANYHDAADCVGVDCASLDLQFIAHIDLDDFGGDTPSLVNVCSYPSGPPNSNAFDCIVPPDTGFILVTKDAGTNTTAEFSFNVTPATGLVSDTNPFGPVTGGSTTGLIAVDAGTYAVTELPNALWELDTAVCDSGTSNGVDAVTGIEVPAGQTVNCLFTNKLRTGTLKLVKKVNNLGESGTGYLLVSDFPLTIDGNSTTSGTAVTVLTGDHTIVEQSQTGYTVGTWECDDGTNGTTGSVSATVNVGPGEDVICEITNTLIANPAMTVVKSSTTSGLSAPATVPYSYLVTNTGNVTLTNISLSDDNDQNDMSCPATTLAPAANMTCTASHAFTQDELDANGSPVADSGVLYNEVTASSDETDDVTDDLSIPITQTPALALTKTASPLVYSAVGDVIHYDYVLTNTGNVSLYPTFVVFDDKSTDENCPQPTSLAPGASITCTATYTIQAADVKSDRTGSVTNVAYATADDVKSEPVTSNEDDATVRQAISQIGPTQTTCEMYRDGTAEDYEVLFYNPFSKKGVNTVGAVNPGVIYYWTSVTAPAPGGWMLEAEESNIASDGEVWHDMGTLDVFLWDANCDKVLTTTLTYDPSDNDPILTITDYAPGATYYFSVKYNPSSLSGQLIKKTAGNWPSAIYTIETWSNGVVIATTPDSVTIVSKK